MGYIISGIIQSLKDPNALILIIFSISYTLNNYIRQRYLYKNNVLSSRELNLKNIEIKKRSIKKEYYTGLDNTGDKIKTQVYMNRLKSILFKHNELFKN